MFILIPTGIVLCVAVVLAILQQWKNAIIALLLSFIVAVTGQLFVEARINSARARKLIYYENQIERLERQLEETISNKSIQATPEGAPD